MLSILQGYISLSWRPDECLGNTERHLEQGAQIQPPELNITHPPCLDTLWVLSSASSHAWPLMRSPCSVKQIHKQSGYNLNKLHDVCMCVSVCVGGT